VNECAATLTDRSEVIYRPEKHSIERVVVSDGQTLASRLGPYRIMLDDPKPPCREAALKGV